jgi:ABC-type transport system involved in multi-copper enzyme maturation permease subunit
MLGPILAREWLVAPRRVRFYLQRVVFVLVLFSLVCTAWALLAGVQSVRNIGDLSRFGLLVFQIVAPLELAVTMFLSAVSAAGNVAQEKDRRTLVLLLLTRLSNVQIVMGKLGSSLLSNTSLILSALPLFLLIALLGGVSLYQVWMVTLIIGVTSMWCGALANMVAFWREKTFQTLAITFLMIAGWLVFCELIAAGSILGIDPRWAQLLSPARALWLLCQPLSETFWLPVPGGIPAAHCAFGLLLFAIFSSIAVWRLRHWNPSQQVQLRVPEPDEDYSASRDSAARDSASRDSADGKASSWKVRSPRPMWNNPILWREMRTWAYGRKLLIIRIAYGLLFLVAILALNWSVQSGVALQRSRLADELLPTAAKVLAPFLAVSLVMINALAVNSITNERDAQALDLLLATQITPGQFMLGKIVGVLYVTKEMVLLPIALVTYLWWQNGITLENLGFTVAGLLVVNVFAAMMGIHCGMMYSQSRVAIGTSLGTLFFLLLGIATCMMIMVSFRGSFARQLPPFLAIILGGGTGLFVALGSRNPSPAIALSAFGLPFLTFFAITSFILRNQEMTVFLVITVAYGFASLAMLIPALSELDFDMGKSRNADDGI